jgi:hypothetical protein
MVNGRKKKKIRNNGTYITFEEFLLEEKPYSDTKGGLDKWFKENGLIYQN